MGKLKIEGIWTGVLDVDLETWTISMLREEVAKKSNRSPDSINLIYIGKILNDGDGQQKLTELGIKNNVKILVACIYAKQGKVIKQEIMDEEERFHRLVMVKEAATALAKKYADLNMQVEEQSGKKVKLVSENGQSVSFDIDRPIMMGLTLEKYAKRLLRQQNYEEALEVLVMVEEAFSLCDPEEIELIDNNSILKINMVWCYFMIRDINSLSEAGKRLEMARRGLECVYGKNPQCLRHLYGGLALLMRLELLEGVVSYYNGRLDTARAALISAQKKFKQLHVSDESLLLVMSMGFTAPEAQRALKLSYQDVEVAIDFLFDDKAKKEQKQREILQRRNDIQEEKLYGMTPLKKPVDLQILKDLVSFGFEKEVAAEALRRNENDIQTSLDDLTNPQTSSALQVHIESRKRKREEMETNSEVEIFVQMGFERSRVIAAFEAGGNAYEAFDILVADPNKQAEPNSSAAPTGRESSFSCLLHDASVSDVEASFRHSNAPETDDVKMEDEFLADIDETDALADYGDIDVKIEGKAIAEYLSLVESAAGSKGKQKIENDC